MSCKTYNEGTNSSMDAWHMQNEKYTPQSFSKRLRKTSSLLEEATTKPIIILLCSIKFQVLYQEYIRSRREYLANCPKAVY